MYSLTRVQNEVIKLIKQAQAERKQHMQDFVNSSIRTVVPYILAFMASSFAIFGVNVPKEVGDWLVNALTFLLGTAYYLVVRWLETKYPENKTLGWLLGNPVKPTYAE